jgi:hypothetical protein
VLCKPEAKTITRFNIRNRRGDKAQQLARDVLSVSTLAQRLVDLKIVGFELFRGRHFAELRLPMFRSAIWKPSGRVKTVDVCAH